MMGGLQGAHAVSKALDRRPNISHSKIIHL
jgi:hypothetical protein